MGRNTHVTQEAVKRSYMRAMWLAEVDDLRFRDVRREATTRMSRKGLNIMEVAGVTGHKDLWMLRRYTHPSPDGECRAEAGMRTARPTLRREPLDFHATLNLLGFTRQLSDFEEHVLIWGG